MIEYSIVDAHLHVWDPNKLSYPWLNGVPSINKAFLPEDYRKACGALHVEKMVFVQAECAPAQYHQEADWVATLARQDDRIRGIVAWAPLENGPAVRPVLEALGENRLVKGIRRILQSESDVEFCLRPDFVKAVQILSDLDFSFDICISRSQLPSVTKLVRQCPKVRFILDHIANPDIKNQQFDPWRAQIQDLAELPNVWCKISGMATQADRTAWTKEQLKPYIDWVVDRFGFGRVMYGSDWPVATLATDIPRWVEALDWAVAACTPAEKRKLFHDNACAFYRLR